MESNSPIEHIIFALLLLGGLGFGGWYTLQKPHRKKRRLDFIARYRFNESLRAKIAGDLPTISAADIDRVLEGLRQFFTIAHYAGDQHISMPSKVVDVAWHHFILHSIDYSAFCKQAFGQFYNHTPSSPIQNAEDIQVELKRTWTIACMLENVDPKYPTRIPLLYQLDALLNIEDGHYYELIDEKVRYGKSHREVEQALNPAGGHVTLCGGYLYSCGGGTGGWGGGGGCGGGGCGGGGGGDGG